MNRTGFATALLLSSLWAAPGIAQEDAREEPEAASTTAGDEPGADSDQADSPPPARDDSPYDYRASEEISEDLSVSFPVDI